MTPVSQLPRLLSIDEVAQQLGVSTKTIRRWLLAGSLSCHRLGRQIRIAEDELQPSSATAGRGAGDDYQSPNMPSFVHDFDNTTGVQSHPFRMDSLCLCPLMSPRGHWSL